MGRDARKKMYSKLHCNATKEDLLWLKCKCDISDATLERVKNYKKPE